MFAEIMTATGSPFTKIVSTWPIVEADPLHRLKPVATVEQEQFGAGSVLADDRGLQSVGLDVLGRAWRARRR